MVQEKEKPVTHFDIFRVITHLEKATPQIHDAPQRILDKLLSDESLYAQWFKNIAQAQPNSMLAVEQCVSSINRNPKITTEELDLELTALKLPKVLQLQKENVYPAHFKKNPEDNLVQIGLGQIIEARGAQEFDWLVQNNNLIGTLNTNPSIDGALASALAFADKAFKGVVVLNLPQTKTALLHGCRVFQLDHHDLINSGVLPRHFRSQKARQVFTQNLIEKRSQ